MQLKINYKIQIKWDKILKMQKIDHNQQIPIRF